MLLSLGKIGEQPRGTPPGEPTPGESGSPCEFRFNRADVSLWGSGEEFPVHAASPLMFFFLLWSALSPPYALLSSEEDLASSDLNLDKEKSPLEKCPMLMLRTTRDLRDGLCRTCFSVTRFLPWHGGAATSLSAGWLSVKEEGSSAGKSVVTTPLTW